MHRRKKNQTSAEQDFFLGNMLSPEQSTPAQPTAQKQSEPKPPKKPKLKRSPIKPVKPEKIGLVKPTEPPPLVLPEKPKEEDRAPEETKALLQALSQEKQPKPEASPWENFTKPEEKNSQTTENESLWNADLWKKEEPEKKNGGKGLDLSEIKKRVTETAPVLKEKVKASLPVLKANGISLWNKIKILGKKAATEGKAYAILLAKRIRKEAIKLIRKWKKALAQKKAEKKAKEQAAADAAEKAAARKAELAFRKQYHAEKTRLLTTRKANETKKDESKRKTALPKENESVDLTNGELSEYFARSEKTAESKDGESKSKGKKRAKPHARRDIAKAPLTGADAVKASLDGMYGVYHNPKKQKKKKLRAFDYVRYCILFICIFGFFSAGFFVFRKLYDYYRAHVVYSELQELVTQKDYFSHEYLKKASISIDTLTPEEILAGKKPEGEEGNVAFTEAQETLVNKIGRLKKINPDTAGWISIAGTVVDYPVVWSASRNYYLHRDFYGKTLSGGAIFIDERNDPDITKNRNTVIYGHNMADGSMFASVHDYASASVFYGTKIEIATQNGIYVYTPFSVHHSNAFDNYFETDFVSDDDFIDFCEQMAFLSLHETSVTFNKNSQIITLSTCMDNETATEERFAVHAILTQVIR